MKFLMGLWMKMKKLILMCLLASVVVLPMGCALFGVIANAIPQYVKPKYTGLQNQSVAVMVWADRAIRVDYPSVQMDIAGSIQKKMVDLTTTGDRPDELKGMTMPVKPQSIYRYQQDHPEIDGMPIADIAPRFGVTRLLYIEVERLTTRSTQSLDLFRGGLVATLKVLEIKDGKATVAYTENNVGAIFPPKSREEGVPGSNDYLMYMGVVNEFSTAVVRRLITYEEER
jgi:hypothetical protein